MTKCSKKRKTSCLSPCSWKVGKGCIKKKFKSKSVKRIKKDLKRSRSIRKTPYKVLKKKSKSRSKTISLRKMFKRF